MDFLKLHTGFFSAKAIDDDFTLITMPTGASELEFLNDEIERINIEENFHLKNFSNCYSTKFLSSALSSFIELSPVRRVVVGFASDGNNTNLLVFKPEVTRKKT